ncbi:MAG: DUF1127 domain-containing protein [Gammaproteobacteria bacterium]
MSDSNRLGQHAEILRPLQRAVMDGIVQGFTHGVEILVAWQNRHVERRQLASFSDDALKDIGITRVEAEQETSKPFWRA